MLMKKYDLFAIMWACFTFLILIAICTSDDARWLVFILVPTLLAYPRDKE